MDADVAVTGAGAVGASAALHLARMGLRVLVLEKEPAPARHQSGRNSGVIHAGYNLLPGSAKARYCVEGNHAMHAFCEEHGVAVHRGGILVVARDDQEAGVLQELERRSHENGVHVRMLGPDGMAEREPHAAGVGALWARDGSSVDALGYVEALLWEAQAAGAEVRYGTRLQDWREAGRSVRIRTSRGPVTAKVLLNAAGLHADRVAAKLGEGMRVVPFRGFYARLRPQACHLVRSHLYAAPDLRFPFLGVHLSRRVDGEVFVGPGAMLAFGREAYRFWRVQPRDLWTTLAWPGFWRMLQDPRMRRLVRGEVARSLRLRAIWREAQRLVPDLRPGDLQRGAPAGNRAQLVARDGTLVDDIVVRATGRTVHVLNAVSPGLTCSLPFGRDLAKRAAGMV